MLCKLIILIEPIRDCYVCSLVYDSEEVAEMIKSRAISANAKPSEIVKKIARAVVSVINRPIDYKERMQLNRYLNSFNPFTDNKSCAGYKAHQTLMQKFAIDLNFEVCSVISICRSVTHTAT